MTIRLNKVTRDLNVGISTVVEFLQKKGHTIEASPNTKITEEQYAELVKEFSKDKNLRIESEKFIQERQNKDRNKASIAIEGYEQKKKAEKEKAEEMIETVIPEDVRPKFKQVGKIDLDNLNKKSEKPTPANKSVEEPKPIVNKEVPQKAVVEEMIEQPQVIEETVIPDPVVVPIVEEPQVEEIVPQVEEEVKPVKDKKQIVEEVETIEETVPVEVIENSDDDVEESEDDEVFKIRSTEFVSKINVVGQIDLEAINQSTRPKKKIERRKT